jgi:hypothetical protein
LKAPFTQITHLAQICFSSAADLAQVHVQYITHHPLHDIIVETALSVYVTFNVFDSTASVLQVYHHKFVIDFS